MQLGLVLQILLAAAIIAGAYATRERRKGKDRRGMSRGGRRAADGAAASAVLAPHPPKAT